MLETTLTDLTFTDAAGLVLAVGAALALVAGLLGFIALEDVATADKVTSAELVPVELVAAEVPAEFWREGEPVPATFAR